MSDREYGETRRYGGRHDPRNAGREAPRGQVTVRDEDFEPASVKFVHRDGYGFVRREGKTDAYFHVERLDPEVVAVLTEDLEIEVAVGDGKRGPNVLAMRLIES